MIRLRLLHKNGRGPDERFIWQPELELTLSFFLTQCFQNPRKMQNGMSQTMLVHRGEEREKRRQRGDKREYEKIENETRRENEVRRFKDSHQIINQTSSKGTGNEAIQIELST